MLIVNVPALVGVSIPFKRESGDKEGSFNPHNACLGSVSIPFKRESGDKVTLGNKRKTVSGVSIPFKRESGDKGIKMLRTIFVLTSIRFNSLQTGKWRQS